MIVIIAIGVPIVYCGSVEKEKYEEILDRIIKALNEMQTRAHCTSCGCGCHRYAIELKKKVMDIRWK